MKLQLTYDVYEDRLMLRVGFENEPAQGYWLTRRMTALLIGVLGQQLEAAVAPELTTEAKHWMLEIQREAAMEKNAPSIEPALALPPSPPILASTVKYGRTIHEKQLVLTLEDQAGQGQALALSDELTHIFLQMLEQESAKAGWELSPANQQNPALLPTETQTMH